MTQVVNRNTHGLPALADEIYLEILSYIPSVPIPTATYSPLHPNLRRSRHEILLSLSQTCRTLRLFFWRYLWQRVEVREGMQVWKNEFLKDITYMNPFSQSASEKSQKQFALELIRQLEIVTVHNQDLAQHVNYLDIRIGEYLSETVLTELARCMGLLSNLHTVQIDITQEVSKWQHIIEQGLKRIFANTFKNHSYPQIRNVFISPLTLDFISSCPEAKRVGFSQWMSPDNLLNIARRFPCLEALDDFGNSIRFDNEQWITNNYPALRHISISPAAYTCNRNPQAFIDVLTKMNHLQSITLAWVYLPNMSNEEAASCPARVSCVEAFKHILVAIQRRDNLVKFINVMEWDGTIETITLKPPRRRVGAQ